MFLSHCALNLTVFNLKIILKYNSFVHAEFCLGLLKRWNIKFSDVEESRAKVAREVIAKVRENIGPVASFKDVIIVPRLPKTRSGKIARNTLAAIAAGLPYKVRAHTPTPRHAYTK